MDPEGIWEQLPAHTFRHGQTPGIIAFSFESNTKKPFQTRTIATITRNATFDYHENSFERMLQNFIEAMDITHFSVYWGSEHLINLLRKFLNKSVIRNYSCDQHRKCEMCHRKNCSV
ncbi:hypothetical protein NPIL_561451 [Nephila pilipes]|uniref:Uncharacterized protein n=1 Tax=Nephila pilipes TaxID=299642 RepID=A0A8X6UQG2_NEPPI|nr:hypothetical protein NPIL_561451 [Nephila pilipes]